VEDVHARVVATLCVAFTFATVPLATAAERRCVGDDVAALDQYCERLAAADGAQPTGTGGITLADILPRGMAARLVRADPIGRALLLVPAPAGAVESRHGLRPARFAVSGSLLPGGDQADSVLKTAAALAQGEGVGDGFRWALALSTLSLAGAAGYRRHR
jgi:hypothetical protein